MSSLAPIRHAPFRYLVAGEVITMLGSAMAPIALAFAVLDLTGSVTALGLVVGTRSLTNVLFLLFGGVVADRLPRQLVVVASSTVAGLSQGGAALLVLGHWASVPLLAGLAGVNGIASSFGFPATSALVPQTVPGEIRKQANTLNRLGINTSMIVGAALGGVLVAAFGPGWGLAIDALSFLASAGCFALVRVASASAREHRSTLYELREGWREFIGRTWVWVVVLAFCFINAAVVAGVSVLGPAVADHTIGRRSWGVVLAAHTAGMVAGAFVALRLKVRRLLLVGMVCSAGDVLLLVPLGVAPQVGILVAGAFLGGIGLEQFGIAWETSVQEHVPADKLARVYSYDALGSFVAIPLGQVTAGPVAQLVGTGPALLGAAGIVLVAIGGTLLSRQVRTLEHRPDQAAEEGTPQLA
jgi:MFS family permease